MDRTGLIRQHHGTRSLPVAPGRPYPASAAARLEKSARLAVLLELDRDGLLEGRSNQAIADLFGRGYHRSTILRDLRQLAELKREVSRLRLKLNSNRLRK